MHARIGKRKSRRNASEYPAVSRNARVVIVGIELGGRRRAREPKDVGDHPQVARPRQVRRLREQPERARLVLEASRDNDTPNDMSVGSVATSKWSNSRTRFG